MNERVTVKGGTLLGPDGKPIQRRRSLGAASFALDSGIGGIFGQRRASYEAGSTTNPDLSGYTPFNLSPQAALALDHGTMQSRVHDMARNNGWASAAFSKQVDSIIGSGWRLTAKPNAEALGISPDAADALAENIETEWRDYTLDADSCDARQTSNMGQLLALAFRHRVTDGEALAAILWLDDRPSDWNTAVQIIHPDRLSNPYGNFDSTTLRQGIEIGQYGEPLVYHIRDVHPGDFGVMGARTWRWEAVRRNLPNGRRQIIHAYEASSADMVRGVSPLAPILQKLHMLDRYDKAELQAAVINAVLAAFVKSPDQTQVKMAMEQDPTVDEGGEMSALQEDRINFYASRPISMPGAQVTYLYPTDDVELSKPQHPNAAFDAFYRTGLRNIAAATGLSYEQLSMDWSQSNYSSARGALLEVYKGFTARKDSFAHSFMGPIYGAWLEEAIDNGRVKLPPGAPDFRSRRQAYTQVRWIGPARGWVDPLKEAEAAVARMTAGFSTLEKECADQGEWWVDIVKQRARERRFLISEGLDPDLAIRTGMAKGTVPGTDTPPAPPAAPGQTAKRDDQ